jgi:hypothetical protein
MTPPKNRAKSENVRGFTYKNTLSAFAVESAGDGNLSWQGKSGSGSPMTHRHLKQMHVPWWPMRSQRQRRQRMKRSVPKTMEQTRKNSGLSSTNADQVSATRTALNGDEMRVVCFRPLGFCKVGCSFYSEG